MVELDDSEQPENKSSEENESDDEPLGSLKFKKNLEKVQRNKSLTKESTINSDDDLLIEVKSAKKIALKDVQSSASSVDRKCSKISISNSEDELLIDIKVNKSSALKDNNNKTLNKLGLDMDIPDIRKSSRKRKTASKFTTLINDVGLDSDDSKKKVRDQINEKGDSDSDFDNNSDGEDGDDVSENSSNHDEGKLHDFVLFYISEIIDPGKNDKNLNKDLLQGQVFFSHSFFLATLLIVNKMNPKEFSKNKKLHPFLFMDTENGVK